MICSKNGIKREGESCTKNNNCVYPKCLIMTDLEKFQKVNASETIEDLCQCILDFADEDGQIQGRTRTFDAQRMKEGCLRYYHGESLVPNVVTREFGLRQQLLYLCFYK